MGVVKKEEKRDEEVPKFKGDEECFITFVQKREEVQHSDLFEGINVPKHAIDLINPIKTSNARDLKAFNNPGFRKKEAYWE